MNAADTRAILEALIRCRSITPNDAGCQALVTDLLASHAPEHLQLDYGQTKNLCLGWGQGRPHLLLLGHSDVVPPGPREDWKTDPFEPVVRDGILFGRGAADMKASLAAMVTAIDRRLTGDPLSGRLTLMITSDEEGDAFDGVQRAAPEMVRQLGDIDYCLIGEPSSARELADTIRVGRRGSLTGRLRATGKQGHVAYPDLADNAIHRLLPALDELATHVWDQGSEQFPPSSLQIVQLTAGDGTSNVIPGRAEVLFNIRYSTAHTDSSIRQHIEDLLKRHQVNASIDWHLSGRPFYSDPGPLRDAVLQAIDYTGLKPPRCDTGGGTSDGRFIAPLGAEVIELGPVNASIHQANEQVRLSDVDRLVDLYARIIHQLL